MTVAMTLLRFEKYYIFWKRKLLFVRSQASKFNPTGGLRYSWEHFSPKLFLSSCFHTRKPVSQRPFQKIWKKNSTSAPLSYFEVSLNNMLIISNLNSMLHRSYFFFINRRYPFCSIILGEIYAPNNNMFQHMITIQVNWQIFPKIFECWYR